VRNTCTTVTGWQPIQLAQRSGYTMDRRSAEKSDFDLRLNPEVFSFPEPPERPLCLPDCSLSRILCLLVGGGGNATGTGW